MPEGVYPSSTDALARLLGLSAATFPDWPAATSAVTLTNGVLYACACLLPGGRTITRLGVHVRTVGAAITLARLGIWGPDYTLLASTANDPTLGTVGGSVDVPLTVPYVQPDDGYVYLGGLWVATTPPKCSGGVSVGNTTYAELPSSGAPWWFFHQSGLADLPDPAVPAGTGQAIQVYGLDT